MKLFTRSFLIIGLLIFGTQATLAVTLDACTPRAILDYSGQNIPTGSNCTLAGSPGVPFSFTTPNFTGSTNPNGTPRGFPLPVNTTGSSVNYTYTLSCAGSGATSSAVTFTVPPNTGCNQTPPQKYDCATLCQACVVSGQPNPNNQPVCSANISTVAGCASQCSGAPYNPPAGTITGSFDLTISAPVNGQCAVNGGGTTVVSGGATTKAAQIRTSGEITELNAQGTIGNGGRLNFNQRGIGIGKSLTGNFVVTEGFGENSPVLQSLGSDNVTCAAAVGACGDGTRQPPEQCDDGNTISGDGCSSLCKTEGVAVCGDGIIQSPEQCDMGNANGGPRICTNGGNCDGCSCSAVNADPVCRIVIPSNVSLTGNAVGSRIDLGYEANTIGSFAQSRGVAGGFFDDTSGNFSSSFINGDIPPDGISYFTIRTKPLVAGQNLITGYILKSGTQIPCENSVTLVAGAPTPIQIGWTAGYDNTPISRQAPGSADLYVNTGGRTGCSVSGNFIEGNTVGINMPVGSTPSFNMGASYAVANRPVGNYPYTLSCPGVATPVTANLTVTAAPQSTVSCTPSTQSLVNGSASIAWATTLGNNPTCTVNGTTNTGILSGSFLVSSAGAYQVSCTNTRGATGSATCSVTNPPAQGFECLGGTGACTACGGSTGQECKSANPFTTQSACEAATTCGDVAAADNAQCGTTGSLITSPANARITTGSTFNVGFRFQNVGGITWAAPTYIVSTKDNTYSNWKTVFGSKSLLPTPLSHIGSQFTNVYGQAFTAPTSAGKYNLAFNMYKNGSVLGSACLVNSNGTVTVVNPECSDGVDNGDPEDFLDDEKDPGCIRGNPPIYDPNWDNETDPAPGVVLKISANPQLVRQGGSSVVSYEVNKCEDPVTSKPLAWNIQEGGVSVASGSGSSNGSKQVDSNYTSNIQSKKTFVLSCGGTTRSATISVIKINEF